MGRRSCHRAGRAARDPSDPPAVGQNGPPPSRGPGDDRARNPPPISRPARRARAVESSSTHRGGPGADRPPAAARVLRRRLQLRRDVPRHPGPGDPRRRLALRGRHRPQAAARPVPVRGHVRARSGAPRCGPCGSPRCSRSRSPRSLLAAEARRRWGDRAAWLAALLFVAASVAFAPQDGQAANFEVFMLPAMTAALLLAARDRPRGSGFAVAIATLAKQTGAATLIPVLYLAWKHRGRRGVTTTLGAFAIPLAIVALLVGPGDLIFWAVTGNGSYFGLGSATAYVVGLFAVMTFAFIACNLPIVWTIPTAWRRRVRGRGHRPLAVAAVGGALGGGRPALLRPLLPAAAPAAVPDQRRRARPSAPTASPRARWRSRSPPRRGSRSWASWPGPWGDEPKYERVSQYLERHLRKTDRVFVWGHEPEIYWASGALPGTRFLSDGFVNGNWGGRPPGDTSSDVPDAGRARDAHGGSRSSADRATSSTRRRPRSAARSTTR